MFVGLVGVLAKPVVPTDRAIVARVVFIGEMRVGVNQ